MRYGELLNTVKKSRYPCPNCRRYESIAVYARAAVWQCGYVADLPPLPWNLRKELG